MPKEYLYRVSNSTPGAKDRLVVGHLPGQALRFVSEDTLSVELCDGITAAELVMAGIKIERAVPAATPDPEPGPKPAFDPAVCSGQTILASDLGMAVAKHVAAVDAFRSAVSAVQPTSVGAEQFRHVPSGYAEPSPQPDERL
jgi:hypothetical protein